MAQHLGREDCSTRLSVKPSKSNQKQEAQQEPAGLLFFRYSGALSHYSNRLSVAAQWAWRELYGPIWLHSWCGQGIDATSVAAVMVILIYTPSNGLRPTGIPSVTVVKIVATATARRYSTRVAAVFVVDVGGLRRCGVSREAQKCEDNQFHQFNIVSLHDSFSGESGESL